MKYTVDLSPIRPATGFAPFSVTFQFRTPAEAILFHDNVAVRLAGSTPLLVDVYRAVTGELPESTAGEIECLRHPDGPQRIGL